MSRLPFQRNIEHFNDVNNCSRHGQCGSSKVCDKPITNDNFASVCAQQGLVGEQCISEQDGVCVSYDQLNRRLTESLNGTAVGPRNVYKDEFCNDSQWPSFVTGTRNGEQPDTERQNYCRNPENEHTNACFNKCFRSQCGVVDGDTGVYDETEEAVTVTDEFGEEQLQVPAYCQLDLTNKAWWRPFNQPDVLSFRGDEFQNIRYSKFLCKDIVPSLCNLEDTSNLCKQECDDVQNPEGKQKCQFLKKACPHTCGECAFYPTTAAPSTVPPTTVPPTTVPPTTVPPTTTAQAATDTNQNNP